MPIPTPAVSDSDLRARVDAALMAWRRVTATLRAARAPGPEPLASLSVLLKSYKSIEDDLEAIAHAFDAFPSLWAHIGDLRRELKRTSTQTSAATEDSPRGSEQIGPADFSTAPDLAPPWVLFSDKGAPVAILPAMRPGEVADVRGMTRQAAQAIVDAANRLHDLLIEAGLEALSARLASLAARVALGPVTTRDKVERALSDIFAAAPEGGWKPDPEGTELLAGMLKGRGLGQLPTARDICTCSLVETAGTWVGPMADGRNHRPSCPVVVGGGGPAVAPKAIPRPPEGPIGPSLVGEVCLAQKTVGPLPEGVRVERTGYILDDIQSAPLGTPPEPAAVFGNCISPQTREEVYAAIGTDVRAMKEAILDPKFGLPRVVAAPVPEEPALAWGDPIGPCAGCGTVGHWELAPGITDLPGPPLCPTCTPQLYCKACLAATGGQCPEHHEPECTCYELHGANGGHQPGCPMRAR